MVPDPPKQSRHVVGQKPRQLIDSATINGEKASLKRYQRWNGKLWLGTFDDIGAPSTRPESQDERLWRATTPSSGQFSSMKSLMLTGFTPLSLSRAAAHSDFLLHCAILPIIYVRIQVCKNEMVDFPPAEVTAQAMSEVIEAAWRNKLFTQDMAAEALGMSQSQISKIIRGQFKKPKGNAKALYEYSKGLSESRPEHLESTESMRALLTERLFRAWDGTAEGGRALGDILDGAHKLRMRRA